LNRWKLEGDASSIKLRKGFCQKECCTESRLKETPLNWSMHRIAETGALNVNDEHEMLEHISRLMIGSIAKHLGCTVSGMPTKLNSV
jgi:hypothetical protein